MSINHFSPNFNSLWTTSQQYHQQELLQPFFMETPTTTTTTTSNNLKPHDNDDDDDNEDSGQRYLREPMFEKPLTPSDVGKLNRLVIPKQHAEKYFPLHDSSNGSGGGGGGDKGMLLSFEDESGRCWRFRYSYWSSSQSYVLTKGWSKYVKDKGLDAGDVVLFERQRHGQQRHQNDGEKLFIGWRRRGGGAAVAAAHDTGVDMSRIGASVGGGSGWTSGFYNTHHAYPAHLHQVHPIHSGHVVQNRTMPEVGNSRKLRLFGVNMEFQAADESEPLASEGSSLSTYHPDSMHRQFYS